VTYCHTLYFRTISGISRALDILTAAFYREDKNVWSHTSNPHIRLHGVDRDKFILCAAKTQQHRELYFLLRNQYGYGKTVLE